MCTIPKSACKDKRLSGRNPLAYSFLRVYVVVVANDLAMVEAPVRTRIDALNYPRCSVTVARQRVRLLDCVRLTTCGLNYAAIT